MTDILAEIARLQKFHDEHTELEEKYILQFKLAGYELNHPDTTVSNESADGPIDTIVAGQPKTLAELIEEALGNPPTEPGKWIRIMDIPQYIRDYLILPDKTALDDFNEKPHAQAPRTNKRSNTGSLDSYDDVEPEYNLYDDETKTFNDMGEPDPDFEKTGQTWIKASLVPVEETVVDPIGDLWYKVGPSQWASVNGFDEQAPDYSTDAEVSLAGVLSQVKAK